MNSAVLLLVFNRPGPTRKVLASVRDASPHRLYVAADGPRTGVEERKIGVQRCEKYLPMKLTGHASCIHFFVIRILDVDRP